MNKTALYIAISILLSACSTGYLFTTNKIEKSGELSPKSIVYSLPQTSISIDLEIVHHTQIAGPYSAYAQKYLNISNALDEDSSWYEINNIYVNDYLETDPDHYYKMTFEDMIPDLSSILKLTEEGLIVSPDLYNSMQNYNITSPDKKFYPYTDHSVKRNFVLERETYYQIEFKDSLFVKTPLWKDEIKAKTIEDKAEEASNFIIKTRKRRFKLLAGQYDIFPKGDALAISVEELNKTEQQYLSLFIGKRYQDTLHYRFTITPKKEDYSNYIVTYFSPVNGITNSDLRGDPIIITLLPSEKTKNLERLSITDTPNAEENQNIVYYRIPDKVNFDLEYKTKNLVSGMFLIHQYGKILTMPVGW